MSDPYGEIAEWYDLEHDPLSDDLECYIELLSKPAGNTSGAHSHRTSVLEVGSGTGRIAAGLATAGFDVTGIEPSPAMRERAVARLRQLPPRVARRIHIVAGAADNYGDGVMPGQRYHAILYGLNTFAHLTDYRARAEALAVARSHLEEDGLLLIDLDLAGPRRLLGSPGQLYLQGSWMLPTESDRWVSHLVSGVMGPEPGTLVVTHWYDVFRSGHEVVRSQAQMPMAVISRGELELAVAVAGFETLAAYGGFDLAPPDDLSARAILLACQRPNTSAG
jgi:SAM-dependent methyltransferase